MTSTARTRARRRPAERRARRGHAEEPEERPGPSRRRYLARRWMALLIVLAMLGLTYVVMFTSLIGVRTVEVVGTHEIPQDTVRRVAAIELGTPMVRLDTDEVARRVATLPRVFSVSVSRSFPTTVEIHVTERTPVAVVPAADGVHLVDRTGVDYATVPARPKGLPVLKVVKVAPDDPATHAAVTVYGAIPGQLRKRVVELSARSPGDVRLKLSGGKIVKWGNAEDNDRKSAVLAPLLTRPGRTYDVATPDFPTVS